MQSLTTQERNVVLTGDPNTEYDPYTYILISLSRKKFTNTRLSSKIFNKSSKLLIHLNNLPYSLKNQLLNAEPLVKNSKKCQDQQKLCSRRTCSCFIISFYIYLLKMFLIETKIIRCRVLIRIFAAKVFQSSPSLGHF